MQVAIIVPAYNEELILEKNIRQLASIAQAELSDYFWRIIIAENSSQDNTDLICRRLTQEIPSVSHLIVSQRGKGNAWLTAVNSVTADVYVFMDADLATDLSALKKIVVDVASGNDLVIGSRFLAESVVKRSLKRSVVSHVCSRLARLVLGLPIKDWQCGFKGFNQLVKNKILPQTRDRGFFLDTELIYLSWRQGLKVKEIPVTWSDFNHPGRTSKVRVFRVGLDYLIKLFNLRFRS